VSVLTAPAHRDPGYRHAALLHDGPDELAAALAPDLADALDAGDAVLVSTNDTVWRRLAASLGRRADDVQYLPDDVRYERPAVAVKIVHDVVRRELARGAGAVWSIGAIPFDGDRDVRWLRYEAAVDDVLAGLPLCAVCTYDTGILGADLVDAALRSHQHVLDGDGWRTSPRDGSQVAIPTPVIDRPGSPPIVDAEVDAPAAARRLVLGAQDGLDRDELDDLLLAVSELVANAHRHGRPPVGLRVWIRADRVLVEVTDDGDGIDDPFFELRPPQLGVGRAGLWIVGQVSDVVASTRTPTGAHAMVAELRRTCG
jgi:anti-sigma regulatory factor (Ser/Thr protein kinase)